MSLGVGVGALWGAPVGAQARLQAPRVEPVWQVRHIGYTCAPWDGMALEIALQSMAPAALPSGPAPDTVPAAVLTLWNAGYRAVMSGRGTLDVPQASDGMGQGTAGRFRFCTALEVTRRRCATGWVPLAAQLEVQAPWPSKVGVTLGVLRFHDGRGRPVRVTVQVPTDAVASPRGVCG